MKSEKLLFGYAIITLTLLASTTITITATPATGMRFTDDTGFTVDLPSGWVAQDLNNTKATNQTREPVLAIFCPQELAPPAIGGGINCEAVDKYLFGVISVIRYNDVDKRTEFSGVQNITSKDLFAYDAQQIQRSLAGDTQYSPFKFLTPSNNDTVSVNVSLDGGQKNKIITGALAAVTYNTDSTGASTDYALYFVNGTTGYELSYRVPEYSETFELLGPVDQIMRSVTLQGPTQEEPSIPTNGANKTEPSFGNIT